MLNEKQIEIIQNSFDEFQLLFDDSLSPFPQATFIFSAYIQKNFKNKKEQTTTTYKTFRKSDCPKYSDNIKQTI